jgi:cyclic-di-GMP-binding protein
MLHTEFLLGQRPGVANAKSAKEWIRDQPLTDARVAHHAVSGLITEFDDTALPALDRLEILETLRPHIVEIDRLYAARYVAKPLPLGPAERNAFDHARALWQRLEEAYWRCARAALAQDATMTPHLALCLARAAHVAATAIAGHVRAGQMIGADAFDTLQRYFDTAQKLHVLAAPVADSLHPKRTTSVAAIYRRALMIKQGAGSASGRERDCVIELAEVWEGKTTMRWLPASNDRLLCKADLPPAVDGVKQCIKVIHAGQWMHMVDMTLVSRSLRRRIHKMALGAKPEELRLPASFGQGGAEELLKRLHSAWCEEANGRVHTRLQAKPGAKGGNRVSLAHVGSDFNTLYYMVNGEAFILNDEDPIMSRRHAEELFMFQHAARAKIDAKGDEAAQQFEDWEVQDESASGFRLKRERAGVRFRRGQLAALRLRGGNAEGAVLLTEIRWLAEPVAGAGAETPGAVEAGLSILHGKVRGVGLRATGVNAQGGRQFHPGFVLKGQQAGESGLRVIVPVGWYKPRRVVEVREDAKQVYKLLFDKLVHRGVDFEVVEACSTD